MKSMNTISKLLQLFIRDNNLIFAPNYTYKEFLEFSKERSQQFKSNENSEISLCVENTLEHLIDIFSIWLLNKSVILHPLGTPKEIIQEYELEIKKMYQDSKEDIACYIFTSGSTSRPKPIPLTFSNLLTAADNYNKHFNITEKSYLPITLPLYHVGGLLIFFRAVSANAKISIHKPGSLKASDFSKTPSHLSVVPLQLERILDSKVELDFFKETVFVIGGAKTSLNTLKRIEDNNLNASSTYGMTESCAMIMATEVTSELEVLKSVGSPLEGVSISLSEDQTIIIKSPTISPIFKDQTIHTNDKAYFDSGLYFIEGRVDDVFISGGENINPLEIEKVFLEEGLEDAFIIPVDDIKYGKKSFLFYRGEKSVDEVRNIAKDKLTSFKRPRHYFKIPEFAFSGIKIKKSILKEVAPMYANIDLAGDIFPFDYYGDPRKPWVVFLHGFMGDKSDWKNIVDILKLDFFCLCLDTPGHGDNNLEYTSLSDYQKEFKEFTNILNHKFHLAGYSQGGRIAQGLVLNGLSVESLILESTSPGIVDEEERERRYKTDLKMFKNITSKDDLRKFLIYWYENPLFGDLKNHHNFNDLLQRRSSADWNLWQKSMNIFSVGNQPDYREGLSRIAPLKAITICGENDHKYVASSMEYKTKYKFDFAKISNSSHNTHFENPKEFAKVVSNFLKS